MIFFFFVQFCDAGIGYGESMCGVSKTKILIKGGTVVNAHHQEVADVYVEDGLIVSVKPHIHVCLHLRFFLFGLMKFELEFHS